MKVVDHIVKGSRKGIQIAARVYSPSKALEEGKKPINLLFAHANGFHKELWEPLIRRVEKLFEKGNSKVSLNKIVAFDAVHQGDSAKLNKGKLGYATEKFEWHEYARDILSVLDQFGLRGVDTIGIGHSYGGSSTLLSETLRPLSFMGIFCVDPVLSRDEEKFDSKSKFIMATINRKNGWKTKEEFIKYARSKPVYADWTEESLNIFFDHGTFKCTETQLYKLKADPIFEAASYAGGISGVKNMEKSRHLILCPVEIVYGEHSNVLTKSRMETFASELPHIKITQFKNVGHLMLMEDPDPISVSLYNFINSF
ncbi:hypothetical protein BB559_001699 [Furculomyces boomerangus]|uniref:AB hydrolase-1 domain-containing protein n=1 Tax=Furculomyces boomerangus TaxID=61424 RepID=A0A2T9Z113_9FUNG|nr:hypothetical protein BB559_001699 [Furculomyces boomerangus]